MTIINSLMQSVGFNLAKFSFILFCMLAVFCMFTVANASLYLTTHVLTPYGLIEARQVQKGDFLLDHNYHMVRVRSTETSYGSGWFVQVGNCLFAEGQLVKVDDQLRTVNGTRVWRAGWVDIDTTGRGLVTRCCGSGGCKEILI